jgi:eukaryotic-like serine/threonine-protein kinase
MKTCPNCHAIFPDEMAFCLKDGSALQAAVQWTVGGMLCGRYGLLENYRGEWAWEDFLAVDEAGGGMCILRTLSKDLFADQGLAREFQEQFQMLTALRHENTEWVLGVEGGEDGRPFAELEFVEGESLAKLIANAGPIPLRSFQTIAKRVASALEDAHANGICHGDVHCGQVWVADSAQGQLVKLRGFGMAAVEECFRRRLENPLEYVTAAQQRLFLPEQLMKSEIPADPKISDLYMLGAMFYEMLTGCKPFTGEDHMQIMQKQLLEPAPSLCAIYPDLGFPPDLDDLIRQLLAAEPSTRPPSAQAVADALDQWSA